MSSEQASVLVIDDVETNRDLLSRRLQRQGHLVMMAENGRDAIALLQQQPIDLILCDISMPEMDGYEVLAYLKADLNLRYIPVIMVSAISEVESVVRCIELGAEDYLFKPFNPVILKARVNACLEKKRWRDQEQAYLKQLAQANNEILALNERLQAENLRMSAELKVARRLQQIVLPKERELQQVPGLEISALMEPATEVGGDYYDVLQHEGKVWLGIGDVTGHGLESGVVMLMVQAATRTLLISGETNGVKLLNTINRMIRDNLGRMETYKNMTLLLLDYEAGVLRVSGQHEDILILRQDGQFEVIDTYELGFPLGLEADISAFVTEKKIELQPGDVVVLYTDGITEAVNTRNETYGLERLHAVLQQHRDLPPQEIQQAVINDVKQHIGSQKIFDDMTIVILKQK